MRPSKYPGRVRLNDQSQNTEGLLFLSQWAWTPVLRVKKSGIVDLCLNETIQNTAAISRDTLPWFANQRPISLAPSLLRCPPCRAIRTLVLLGIPIAFGVLLAFHRFPSFNFKELSERCLTKLDSGASLSLNANLSENRNSAPLV